MNMNAIQLNISKRKGESYPDYLHRVLFGDTRFNVALVADSERAYDLQLENIQVRSNLEKEKQRNRELEYNFQRLSEYLNKMTRRNITTTTN
jgi:hypothetical protein